ncbi:hypothetical protein DPMN_143383 [Dreissena polymorpha]|uniref:Uncharacterized protein n=1 Tax=Dreissena polymorpha TaxID=45954 RepID=A0A9D4GCZ2_DREPO|nr:hypothetical protein DPMN_143383 [Dreissena polymorpha]
MNPTAELAWYGSCLPIVPRLLEIGSVRMTSAYLMVEMVAPELSYYYRQVGMLAASIVVVDWLIGENVNCSETS